MSRNAQLPACATEFVRSEARCGTDSMVPGDVCHIEEGDQIEAETPVSLMYAGATLWAVLTNRCRWRRHVLTDDQKDRPVSNTEKAEVKAKI